MLLRRTGIDRIEASVYRIPTEAPEADGTLAWDSTTLVVVEVGAGGETGFGYTYSSASLPRLIDDVLRPVVVDGDPAATPALWAGMVAAVRNLGRGGLCAMAIAAVDGALWDLKAKLLDAPLATLFGQRREAVAVYGSGGFLGQPHERLAEQLAGWVEGLGCRSVKMKIGEGVAEDVARIEVARRAIGQEPGLMVDANGAYDAKQAVAVGDALVGLGVTWFEEPVSSDHVADLRLVRERAPAAVEIAAGEYCFDEFDVRRLLEAGAVDVLQLDATRCCGPTGFLKAAALAEAHGVPVSAHAAPALHLPLCCALEHVRHVEWFHDHARIEAMLFDGAPQPAGGVIRPDLSRPGHGLCFKRQEAERFAV